MRNTTCHPNLPPDVAVLHSAVYTGTKKNLLELKFEAPEVLREFQANTHQLLKPSNLVPPVKVTKKGLSGMECIRYGSDERTCNDTSLARSRALA